VVQRPWSQLSRPYEPIKVLSDDQVNAIHNAALRVLEEVGLRVLDGRRARCFAEQVPPSTRPRCSCASTAP
jgi:trimethylamine--corrinoid protein Co-methyltransferase